MKNKKFVFAFIIFLLGTLCSNAQSSLEKKLRAGLEQSKKHREAMLLKAQEQQRQRQDEKRSEINMNTSQQKNTSATPNAMKHLANQNNPSALTEQPINTPVRKEDINQ